MGSALRRRIRPLLPALVGLAFGLSFGALWWFVWGCRVCDPNGTPEAKILFAAVVGTGVGHFLGQDYVRPRR